MDYLLGGPCLWGLLGNQSCLISLFVVYLSHTMLCHMQRGCSTINKKNHFCRNVPVCLESVPLFPVLMTQEFDCEFGLMMVISSVITSSWSFGLYMVCVCLCEHVIEAEMKRKSHWWRPRPEGLPRQLDWWEQMATQLSVSVCVRKQQRNSAHKSERGIVCTCNTSYIQWPMCTYMFHMYKETRKHLRTI